MSKCWRIQREDLILRSRETAELRRSRPPAALLTFVEAENPAELNGKNSKAGAAFERKWKPALTSQRPPSSPLLADLSKTYSHGGNKRLISGARPTTLNIVHLRSGLILRSAPAQPSTRHRPWLDIRWLCRYSIQSRGNLGMRTHLVCLVVFTAFLGINLSAAVLYVDVNSTNAVAPFSDWSIAATNIQDAVDAAIAGDQIFVTNGIYATGGRTVTFFYLTNRVVVTKPLTIQSVNGAAVTVIQGYQVPGTTNSPAAIRCVYLSKGAVLAGFTITNGATSEGFQDDSGGGVYCATDQEVVSNCCLTCNAARGSGGGAYGGTFFNCQFLKNVAVPSSGWSGGGASRAVLNDCTLTTNLALYGGGASDSTLNNCILQGNTARLGGGGASTSLLRDCRVIGNSVTNPVSSTFEPLGGGTFQSTLTNCLVFQNWAQLGGGSYKDLLWSCEIVGNSALRGGGTALSLVNNCLIISNSAFVRGGGALGGTLNNCTIVGNSAMGGGGGAYVDYGINNCIALFNTVSNSTSNYETIPSSPSPIRFCCTWPLPTGSANFIGNITSVPLFVNASGGDFHLESNSPCINSGNNAYAASGFDLDGNPRIVGGTVDIGAYEFQHPTSIISYAWLEQFGLPIDGSADFTDPDQDGMNNWQEWVAGTDPTNAASALRLISATNTTNGSAVTWQTEPTRNYFLLGTTNFTAPSSFSLLATNILGQTNTTTFFDTNSSGAAFYRVGVQP